jgi:hypothetical protein
MLVRMVQATFFVVMMGLISYLAGRVMGGSRINTQSKWSGELHQSHLMSA